MVVCLPLMCAFLFPNEDQMKKTKKYLSENEIETFLFLRPPKIFQCTAISKQRQIVRDLKGLVYVFQVIQQFQKQTKFIKDAVIRSFM